MTIPTEQLLNIPGIRVLSVKYDEDKIECQTSKPSRIVVEHKDRLTRFGFGYFEQLLPMIGCELAVINRDTEEKDELLKDLVATITSFCCRLYGVRRGQRKAAELKRLCEEPSK